MYKAFFGLTANPFELSPDPFFMVSSEKSKEALASISGAVGRRKGFVVMTGEVGTGKTLILRCLFELWEREQIPFAYFIGPRLSTVDFLSYINFELGIQVDVPTKGNLLRALYGFLLAQFEKGLTTVLIIDEAHQIPRSVLEEIRLLTNFETSQQKLIQIILAGQPELDKKLDSPELRSLKQRIAVRCTLEPLRPEEIRNYVERRLVLAGATPETATSLFPVDTVKAIYRYSQGIQRLINNICDQALIAACTCHIRVVPVEIVEQIASRFRLEPSPSSRQTSTSFSPSIQNQALPFKSSPPGSPTDAPVATVPKDDLQQNLDIEVAAPEQAEPAIESPAAPKINPTDPSIPKQSAEQPPDHAEIPAPELISEPRQASKFPSGPGSSFLAACQHLIDQAVASATDLRAIAKSDQLPTVVAQHDAQSSLQTKLDPAPQEREPLATEERATSPGISTAAKVQPMPSAKGSADASLAPAVSEAPSSSTGSPTMESAAVQAFARPLAFAAAANSTRPVTLERPPNTPPPAAAIQQYAPFKSVEIPKPEPLRPQTQPSPLPLSVAAALSYTSPATPHPAYSPASPDFSINLPDFPEPDALSGYIAALRANRKAEYFDKHKEARQSAAETADKVYWSEPYSAEEQQGDTEPSQTTIKIDRRILISAIVAGLLILGYVAIRYFGRPSVPGQDAAMAAVAHASSEQGTSRGPLQNAANRLITSQTNAKTRGAPSVTSDLQVYKQLGEPGPAAKKSAPGRPRLAAPTVSPRDTVSNGSDAPPEPVIDSQASNVYGLSEGLSAVGHPTTPLPTGGNVTPARLVSSVSPVYPPMAKNMRVQGDVIIDAAVDEKGRVSAMKVVTGPLLLRPAALDALGRWKYQPATLDGKAVATHLTITIQFHIQ